MTKFIIIFIAAVGFSCSINAQTQTIKYGYDLAGNRTSRTILISKSAEEAEENQEQIKPVDDNLGEIKVLIFPNPTKGELKVELLNLNDETPVFMALYDIQGVTLFNIESAGITNLIDISGYPAGNYYLVIKANNLQTNWTIVKQ